MKKEFDWKTQTVTITIPRQELGHDILSHFLEGVHGGFIGRRYRRGKNRCFCGATLNSPSGLTWEEKGRRTINKALTKKLFGAPSR